MKRRVFLGFAAAALTLVLVAVGCAGPQGSQGSQGPQGLQGPAGSPAPTPTATPLATDTPIKTDHNPLTLSQIANIQPGLGTIMIEYTTRFDNAWFAAQKANWDMVNYQIKEMTEIQEVGEITRTNRAPMLKAFEDSSLVPLQKAAAAKDLTAFTTAYDNAVQGCNGCHAANGYKFVKIIRPTASQFNNVDWAGQ